jgi:hypothetical protein
MLTHADAEFDRVYPWAVKSRRQSQLLNAWLQLRQHRDALPKLSDFDAALRAYPDQAELTIYDVVRESEHPRYLIVKESFAFKQVFGRAGTGRFLDDVLPPFAWRTTRPNYDTCVTQRLPVYAAFSVFENDEENKVYERLMLPFGSGPPDVTGLLSSLKTTTWKDASTLARQPDARVPHYSFRAVIGPD